MEASASTPDPSELPAVGETRVGIRELRHDFRAWLDRVQAGERVIVTDRGQPIAELGPHRAHRTYLQGLIANGAVQLRAEPIRLGWSDGDPVTTAGSDALQEQREERLP